jgi:hypothetical protein
VTSSGLALDGLHHALSAAVVMISSRAQRDGGDEIDPRVFLPDPRVPVVAVVLLCAVRAEDD